MSRFSEFTGVSVVLTLVSKANGIEVVENKVDKKEPLSVKLLVVVIASEVQKSTAGV